MAREKRDVHNYIWDTATATWLPETASSGGGAVGSPTGVEKFVDQVLQAPTHVQGGKTSISAVLATDDESTCQFVIKHCDLTPVYPTKVRYRIEASPSASNYDWVPVAVINTTPSETRRSTGIKTVTADTNTFNFTPTPIYWDEDDLVYIAYDDSNTSSAEWHRMQTVTSGGDGDVVLDEPINDIKATAKWWNKAQIFVEEINIKTWKRLRVVCDNNLYGDPIRRDIVWSAQATLSKE